MTTDHGRRVLILNASVVIELIEMDLIEALALYKQRKNLGLLVPRQVEEELDERTQNVLQNLVREGLLELCAPPEELFRQLRNVYLGLGDGELGVLALTLHLRNAGVNAIPVLDDRRARRIAERDLNLAPHGTVWLVKQMAETSSLSKSRAVSIIRSLRSRGFYITDDIVEAIVNQLMGAGEETPISP